MNMKPGLRKHARFAVKWPVTYLNEGLSGEGTVLDISQVGCQVEGTLAVTVGMLLKLLILPPHKEEKLCVEEGRVLWVKEGAFALELQRLPPTDIDGSYGFWSTLNVGIATEHWTSLQS
jgi:hypothetical protein